MLLENIHSTGITYYHHLYLVSGLYYTHTMIINDNSRVIRMTLQVVASPTIVILMTLRVSFMLLDSIHSTGVTYYHHL
jgi:hypothetical protein